MLTVWAENTSPCIYEFGFFRFASFAENIEKSWLRTDEKRKSELSGDSWVFIISGRLYNLAALYRQKPVGFDRFLRGSPFATLLVRARNIPTIRLVLLRVIFRWKMFV